jgi:hypothetical protein
MGVVGSLPSPPPTAPSTISDTVDTSPTECISPTDQSTTAIDETDSSSGSTDRKPRRYHRPRQSSSVVTVMYGPINIRVRQGAAPTLATGRRSKFVQLQGEAAAKREIRRKRNREAAKKLKEKRATIEETLTQQIHDYEEQEKRLLLTIQNLRAQKEHLESECQHIISIQERLARSAFKKVEQKRIRLPLSVPVHHESVRIKEEPRPQSPQWQLLFSI